MPKIIISGCNGRMGQTIVRLCADKKDITIVAGFDKNPQKLSYFPVYADPMEYIGEADVIIDFSNPTSLDILLNYCTRRNIPCVLCTTGYSNEQLVQISHASKAVPVFKSGNMSLGINLLTTLIKKAAAVLGEDFDVEVIEKHHRMKLDAPSGTALMLADAAAFAAADEAFLTADAALTLQNRKWRSRSSTGTRPRTRGRRDRGRRRHGDRRRGDPGGLRVHVQLISGDLPEIHQLADGTHHGFLFGSQHERDQ